jgi:hypothetical protein
VRENGYRHPPLYHCKRGESSIQKRGACREICEEHPCIDVFELIEWSSNSNSWLVLFLCVDDVLMNVCFLVMHFLYIYDVYVIS